MRNINKHYTKLKSISKNTGLVGPLFPRKYSFSPYSACQHACKYCDGRAEKYYVEGDFEKDIVVRENIAELLEEELSRTRELGIISIGSGVSDPYQPIEAEEKLMQQSAEVLAKYNLPVNIMTKSALAMRDIDIWEKINLKNGVTLMVSLTFINDNLRGIFEPGASSVEERLEMLKKFKERGIYVGVLAMPFIPYISDTKKNLMSLLKKLEEIGVDFIIPGALTLRPGKQKDIFMDIIKNKFPQLLGKFKNLYRENRQSGIPIYSYRQQVDEKIDEIFMQSSISLHLPHYLYRNQFPLYDEIYILLNHMQDLYSKRGIDISALEDSLKRYSQWLIKEKKSFNRKRNLNYTALEQKLLFLIYSGELIKLIKNKKMSKFIEEVVLERRTFDYIKLKLK
ncbi:SPL family radical SAM protein [Orenia marismortui]|uniref:SPL family radical SAM protein n=1 Tax=Orenia marismortui TaxID=46469 RepID=UPI00035F90FC|nr:radical SAM protein [Orenia marismortui]